MKKQLLLFLFAIVASVGTMFADGTKIGDLYYNLNKTDKTAEVCFSGEISVNDNSLADWEALPQEFVASATCPADASMLGLKSVKVFADAKYIYILVEPNMDEIDDTEWVPFHVFIDTDNSDATGGYGDEFTDANTDIMLETALIAAGAPNNYNPSVWKWWGEVGGTGWLWSDPAIIGDESNFWGAMIGEGQQPVGASEGVGGKYEIQILRELIPECTWADEFGIGFDIQQNWTSVGILPCVSPTDENPNGMAAKLKVKIANAAATGVISGNVVIPASVSYEGTSYSVTGIADYAFSGFTGLASITIPNSIISIGKKAFSGCSGLTSVTIPNSVTSIGDYAFYRCSSLTSVTLNSNTIVGKDYEYNSNIKSIFGEQVTEYILGDEITSIGGHAFCGCGSLTSVTIGNSVTSIGEWAFSGCSGLTSVSIPNSVTSIGEYAFYNCSSLTSVTIPNSVTSIGQNAFSGCKIDNIYISGTMEEWLNKSWTPGQVSYSYSLFINDVAVTNVVIPNSVTSIGNSAFSGCSSLTSVTIPNSVTSIGDYAFSGCSGLTSVTIPNSVTSIGDGAFCYCSSLTSVTLGTSVKVIEEYAFYDCTAIETITCYSMRPPTVNNGAFENLDYSTIIYVPADYLNTYKMHDFWGVYDVRPIGASKTETTEVKVEPTATTADVVWPAVENAATYELVIKDKNGNMVCTLIFNANGQLTQIAFGAPARNNAAQAAGFAFTVTGLEEGTSYDLTITAKDGNGTTLDEKTIAFTTSSETGVDALQAGELHSSKIMRDGQVLIMRDGKMYNLQGVEVK